LGNAVYSLYIAVRDLQWTRIMTVTAPDNDGYCVVSADAINDAVEEYNITIVARLRFTDNIIPQHTFESMKVTARSRLLRISSSFLMPWLHVK